MYTYYLTVNIHGAKGKVSFVDIERQRWINEIYTKISRVIALLSLLLLLMENTVSENYGKVDNKLNKSAPFRSIQIESISTKLQLSRI